MSRNCNFSFLNRTAERIFRRLVTDRAGNLITGSRTIDTAGGAFMAVHVERIGLNRIGPVFSIAHYYEQNGDLVCDPDMTFVLDVTSDETGRRWPVMPLTFEQGGVMYQVACEIEADGIRIARRTQREQATFANQWMRNIAEQQDMNTIGVLDGSNPDADARLMQDVNTAG
jgi:hypothetical protein